MADTPQQHKGTGIQASSLFCSKCGQAQPVRPKLLLVLPDAEKYAYYCQVCGEELGTKLDKGDTGSPYS